MGLNIVGDAANIGKKPLDYWLEHQKSAFLNKKERLIELGIN